MAENTECRDRHDRRTAQRFGDVGPHSGHQRHRAPWSNSTIARAEGGNVSEHLAEGACRKVGNGTRDSSARRSCRVAFSHTWSNADVPATTTTRRATGCSRSALDRRPGTEPDQDSRHVPGCSRSGDTLLHDAEQDRCVREQLRSMPSRKIQRRVRNRDDQRRRSQAVLGAIQRRQRPVVLLAGITRRVDRLLLDLDRLGPVLSQDRDEALPHNRGCRQSRRLGAQDQDASRSGRRRRSAGRHAQDAAEQRGRQPISASHPEHAEASAETERAMWTRHHSGRRRF